MAMLILLVLLIFFAALGIPLAFAIGASCVTYILIYAPTFITMLPQRVWNGAYSELMIAMPLFMLAGELMNTGGITQRIINFCMELLRPIRGGLGEVNIVASMIFGGISGSSVADTSALGSILIPAMEKEGYPPEASAGITVASSTMGMIIPPSTPMIVYSMISGASVGALFVAGAVPGILIGLTQLVLVYIISAKKGWHQPYAHHRDLQGRSALCDLQRDRSDLHQPVGPAYYRPAAAAGLQHLLSSTRIPLIKTGSAPLRGAVCFLHANRRDSCI